jgi:hypothetical protein
MKSGGKREARERLRRKYRPRVVRLLFIGESPPASGRFFYRGDSGLFRAMREAFRVADASTGDEDFLDAFQSMGCYLVDACGEPVDGLDPGARKAACMQGEAGLARKIRRLKPKAIVTLVKSIRENVRRAAAEAGWSGPIVELPYPGRWASHRKVFVEGLRPHLRKLSESRSGRS